jgi:prohibitin 1
MQEHKLPEIYTNLGVNFNDRVLPSVGNEVLKATVARYNAEELLSKRSVISLEIKQELEKRANTFGLELIDVAITVGIHCPSNFTQGRSFPSL